jgi:hypothetical protein
MRSFDLDPIDNKRDHLPARLSRFDRSAGVECRIGPCPSSPRHLPWPDWISENVTQKEDEIELLRGMHVGSRSTVWISFVGLGFFRHWLEKVAVPSIFRRPGGATHSVPTTYPPIPPRIISRVGRYWLELLLGVISRPNFLAVRHSWLALATIY